MVNGPLLAAWQIDSIRLLKESGLAVPVVMIGNARQGTKESFSQKLRSYPYRNLLYRVWKRFFLRIPSQQYRELPDFLQALPKLLCTTIRKGKYSEYFRNEDIETLRTYHLDFMLRYGFNIIRGEIHTVPKYGVWSFHHADERIFRGGPAGFWELYRKSPVNGVILQRLNDLIDAGVVLSRRNYQSVSHSYAEHLEKILHHSTDMPLEVCKKIYSGDVRIFTQDHSPATAPVNRVPANGAMLVFSGKILCNRIRFHFNRLFRQEKWDIGVGFRTETEHPAIAAEELKVHWLQLNGKGWYGADPFVFVSGETFNAVYEHYDYRQRKGRIDLLSMDRDFNVVAKKTLLESGQHLAYPYLFRHGGQLYMIPETAEQDNVQLYIWDAETDGFTFHSQLLDRPGVDSSLVWKDGYWWLFCGIKGELPNEKLLVFYSQTLEGPYLPHLLNPVKTDPEGARMGGNFHRAGDLLFRPAQYSRRWYGEKIVWWKILHLTPETFEEELCGELAPQSGWELHDGLHTISSDGEFFAVDVKKRRSDAVSLAAASGIYRKRKS